ncbi:hypothetical protein [Halotia branconii]|uniref:Uncharacterized protein n=1 Tax=Halotia branconii CENA392 TaxID=1539056 RepID=A0AAJ6P8Z6_9CYAN|nr:hypothetical protein [Halotia branconii]WGV25215.1 hypothetical protein QI031_26270 [Halotia branconii CENA392]
MAKLTVDIPDELVSQVKSAGYSVETILLKALTQYLAHSLVPRSITETRTWQLCGRFTVSEVASTDILSENTNKTETTNYAEQVDDALYQGF